MRPTVTLLFDDHEIAVALPEGDAGPAPDEARRWLDEQFVALGCEPPRASGKVLTADKVLGVAAAIGRDGFTNDAGLRQAFARAAAAALARPTVRIDVYGRTITY